MWLCEADWVIFCGQKFFGGRKIDFVEFAGNGSWVVPRCRKWVKSVYWTAFGSVEV